MLIRLIVNNSIQLCYDTYTLVNDCNGLFHYDNSTTTYQKDTTNTVTHYFY